MYMFIGVNNLKISNTSVVENWVINVNGCGLCDSIDDCVEYIEINWNNVDYENLSGMNITFDADGEFDPMLCPLPPTPQPTSETSYSTAQPTETSESSNVFKPIFYFICFALILFWRFLDNKICGIIIPEESSFKL